MLNKSISFTISFLTIVVLLSFQVMALGSKSGITFELKPEGKVTMNKPIIIHGMIRPLVNLSGSNVSSLFIVYPYNCFDVPIEQKTWTDTHSISYDFYLNVTPIKEGNCLLEVVRQAPFEGKYVDSGRARLEINVPYNNPMRFFQDKWEQYQQVIDMCTHKAYIDENGHYVGTTVLSSCRSFQSESLILFLQGTIIILALIAAVLVFFVLIYRKNKNSK